MNGAVDDRLTMAPGGSVREAVERIDANRSGAVCVVDARARLLGILTDGDVRRLVLRGADLGAVPVESAMQRRPVTATADFSRAQLLHLMKARSIAQIPIVDDENTVLRVALARDLIDSPTRGRAALVMAGGRGLRLRPLTSRCPKPLLPVGGRPILELIVERLVACGFDDVLVATGYRSRMIEDRLQDGAHLGAAIRYLREEKPTGTAGALGRLPEDLKGDLLVMNGDILTTLDFAGMLESHQAAGADMTLAVRELRQRLEYGAVRLRDEWVAGIDEKPVRVELVNAGIYVVGERMRALVPASGRADMTDLVRWGLDEGRRVRSYPLREFWLDVGRPADYERANREAEAGGFDLLPEPARRPAIHEATR